jgi:iron uptake system component EfeO
LVILLLAGFHAVNPQRAATPQDASAPVSVAVTARQCDPNDLTVEAGKVTFQIVNRSERALEWEILNGVFVVTERENILPGFTQKMTVKLNPGVYAVTCGLLGNPKGS